jgi:hypothetical protein
MVNTPRKCVTISLILCGVWEIAPTISKAVKKANVVPENIGTLDSKWEDIKQLQYNKESIDINARGLPDSIKNLRI